MKKKQVLTAVTAQGDDSDLCPICVMELENGVCKMCGFGVDESREMSWKRTPEGSSGARPRPPTLKALHDKGDGFDRCPVCAWELEDRRCQQCALLFDEFGEVVWDDSFDDLKQVERSVPDTASKVSQGDRILVGEMRPRNCIVKPPNSSPRQVDAQHWNGCKDRFKYTISTDNTACQKSRHKLLFIALAGSSKRTPKKIP